MASIIKRCDCGDWDECPHPWVVRYRTQGGRASRQREQSFGDDLKEAENFLLKVEHDKKAHVFIDPEAGKALFRTEAEAWLAAAHRRGQQRSLPTGRCCAPTCTRRSGTGRSGRSGGRRSRRSSRAMSRKGLSASRIASAHLVINAVFNEAVRNKKLAESPCTDIPVPDVVHAADFILPADEELEALAAGPPGGLGRHCLADVRVRAADRRGPRGRTRCRINQGTTLRVREQVNPTAQLKPLKFRAEGQFRDIPLPLYVSEAIDKHVAAHGTTDDGYLFQGRRHKHVTRRTYQEDFERAAGKAGLPPEFIPHTLRHCYASTALAHGMPDHRGLPLARPQEHRGHPPDLRPPRAHLLGPRPHRPGRRAAAWPGAAPDLRSACPFAGCPIAAVRRGWRWSGCPAVTPPCRRGRARPRGALPGAGIPAPGRARPGAVASSLTYAGKEQRRRSVSLDNLDAAVVASCGLGRKPAAYLRRDVRDAG